MDLFDGFSFGVSSFRRRCDLDLSDCVHTSIHAVFKQEKGNWILQNFGESLQVEDPFRKDQTILPKNTQRRMPDKAMIRLLKKETESVFLIFDDSAAQNNGWKQADRDDPRFLAYGDQLPPARKLSMRFLLPKMCRLKTWMIMNPIPAFSLTSGK